MLAKVESATLVGIEAARVQVEVNLAPGMPSLSIVGLPDASVREAKDRVVAAIRNSGYDFPPRRVTVNLAPAGLRKEGASFDVAIALGILVASEAITPRHWPRCLWLGELALDGRIRPVRGVLPIARSLSRQGHVILAVPAENVPEISCLPDVEVLSFRNVRDIVDWVEGDASRRPVQQKTSWTPGISSAAVDLADIKGQSVAKRALEIAAAGGHNLLFVGPPGTGKSMLAQAMPGILPSWTLEEALDATQIHSVAGASIGSGVLGWRPIRSPHHSISLAGLLGGGDIPMPGEVSLAHRGVLFLDELPEFRRDALEALRQPLEDGAIAIHRARGRAKFPADFLLLAAMNPCPCGYRGHPKQACQCSVEKVQKYVSKISGPLLDRFDLHVSLSALQVKELFDEQSAGEPSASVKSRVERARRTQEKRYSERPGPRSNARLSPRETRRYCPFSSDGELLMKSAVERLGLSARAFDRVRKVARTIADLEDSAGVAARHLAEAIQYRVFDRRNNF